MKNVLLIAVLLITAALTACTGDNNNAQDETPTPEPTPQAYETTPDNDTDNNDATDNNNNNDLPPQRDESLTDLTDIANYRVQISGVTINMGDPVSTIFTIFEVAEAHYERLDMEMPPHTYTFLSLVYDAEGQARPFQVHVANATDDYIPVRDAALYRISLWDADVRAFNAEFINNIRMDITTTEQIMNMFGVPYLTSATTMYYFPLGEDAHIAYMFWFDSHRNIIYGVEMRYSESASLSWWNPS